MSAVHKLITDHLDIWTAADTEKKSGRGRASGNANSVYGIKKLRELILELAVRGKLMPQDPNDEPVSELLKKIINERNSKGLPTKDLEDIPDATTSAFPAEWRQVKLGAITLIERGGSPRPIQDYITNDADGLNWIKIGDTEQGGKYIKGTSEKIRREGLIKTRMVFPGDFLLTNSMSFGRPYISQIEGCIHDGWLRISPPMMLDKDYLYNLLSSPLVVEQFRKAAAGAVVLNLNADKVRDVLIPIPPLEEQHRIVTKVDELMALCDQLEVQHNNAAEAHEQLVSHLLSTLTQSQDAADFNANWQRIATHFDTLFTTESSIDALKQTLLQLAVMGKLVPQDPNDEPASELLKQILNERLNRFGKTKPRKPDTKSLLEKCLSLPSTWEEIEVQDFAEVRLGSTPSRTRPCYWGGNIPWVSSGEVANKEINNTEEKISQLGFENSSVAMIPKGSLLIAIIGQGKTRGQSALLGIDACTNQNVAALIFNRQYVLAEFAWIWAQSKYESHRGDGRGGAQPALNGNIVKGFRFSLPPINEQHRIVAKVDELMMLSEKLKSRITKAKQHQTKLADVLIENSLSISNPLH